MKNKLDYKKCTKCGLWKKTIEDFYQIKAYRRPSCKECFKKQVAKTGKKNRELRKALGISNSTQASKAYMRAYYKNNKEKYAIYNERFKAKHPGYFKKYHRDRRDSGASAKQ